MDEVKSVRNCPQCGHVIGRWTTQCKHCKKHFISKSSYIAAGVLLMLGLVVIAVRILR